MRFPRFLAVGIDLRYLCLVPAGCHECRRPTPLVDVTNPWMRLLLDLPFYGIWVLVAGAVAWWELRAGGSHLSTAIAESLV